MPSALNMLIAVIVGVFLPFLTGYLTNCRWKDWLKFLVVIITVAVVGFIQIAAEGKLPELTWANAASILGMTYIASVVVFWGIVRNSPWLQTWLNSHGIGAKDCPPS
jgi:hypothetical protein